MLRSYIIEMRNITLLLVFIFTTMSLAFAQEVVYEGRLTDYDSEDDLSGVTVSAVSNGSVVYSTSTGRRGNYTMKLPIGSVYTVRYEKNGYVTKTMKVDVTSVNEEDLPIGGRIMPPVDIDLFTERENVDFSFLEEEPVVEWDYDDKKFVMDWDRQVYSRMKKKIDEKLAEAENKKEEQDAKYNALISEGDKLFDKEEYKSALAKYEEAISIPGKETSEHPNNRILEIEELIQQQEEEKLAEQQANQEYLNLVEAADNLASDEDYDGAITKYNEAIKLKPEEQYPKDQVEAMEAAKEKAEKMEEYTQLIEKADDFFEQNSYKASKDFYEQAATLLPSEQYPQDQLDIIQQKLTEQEAEQEQKEKYQEAITKADEFYENESYEAAIEKYEEALTYESAATYPKERIKLAEEALAEQKANAEKQEQFNILVKEGDELVVAGDYEDAIAKFDEALAIMSDSEVETKKQDAQDLLAQEAENKEQEEKIEELLSSANESMSNEEYESALADYEEVLTLDENNTKAIEGKASAEKAIASKKEKEEKKESFDEFVNLADEAFANEKWEEAKRNYQAAKDLFEDDEYVNEQLELVAQKITESQEQEQINEQIQTLLDQAANLKTDNEWKLVVDKYDEALALDDSRDDVRELLESAKQSLEEWNNQQAQQEKFEQLKTEADQLFAQEKWNDAKSKYEEALNIQDDDEITTNIEIIKQKLAELESEQEKEERFNQLVADAEELENDEELQSAIDKYKEALEIKSSANVENKIATLEDQIAKAAENAEMEEAYEKAMIAGREAMDNKDYAKAIKFFDDALLAIPMDSEAQNLKDEAEEALEALKSEEEKYNNILEKAEAALSNEELLEAKSLYEDAQSLRPKATLPQEKIIEIDELLRKREEELAEQSEEEKLNQEYQNKLELADVAAGNFKYEKAIEHLNDALEIKPDEDLPKRKIKEYQALLDQIAAQDAKEKKYNEFIQDADEAFDNESYEESINLYNKALEVKSNESYPSQQIAKAQEAMDALENQAENRVYNDLIGKADQAFNNESYEDALANYKKALDERSGDQYASDKIEETQQILDNLAKEKQEESASNELYDKYIKEADDFYDDEEYIKAKEAYEKALNEKLNDPYAIRRVQESIAKAKAKVDTGDDARYQKILTKADEYFDEENYEKATSLYERALKLRSYDQYPKDKLAEIKAIKNGTFKKKEELEYLGEKENISILEGAALLEKAEDQREHLKMERVQKIIEKNEGQSIDRKIVDNADRAEYENEITRVYDKRSKIDRIERDNKDKTIVDLDEQQYQFEQLAIQENTFERTEILRQNDNLTYISDDFKAHKKSKYDDHSEAIETVKEIRESREDRNRAEATKEKVGVMSTNDQLVDIADDQREDAYRATEMRKENERKVDDLQQQQEKRVVKESELEYARIQQMKSEALLAELSKAESEKEKQVVHEQLKEDIARLENNLKDKNRDETREVYEQNLASDAMLTEASEQYKESQEDNDDARMETVEEIKDLEEDQSKDAKGRNEREVAENQENVEHTEFIKEKEREQLQEHRGEKVELNEKVKEREIRYEREVAMKSKEEEMESERTSDNIENIKINDEKIRKGKAEEVKENDEKIKGVEAAIDAGESIRKEQMNKEKLKSQEILDKMEAKQTNFTAEIANTIGDDFPEGVTQEQYTRVDKDGIPYKIVTRRIVVRDGYGEVYMRIQSKSGVTYSKNNRPITEQAWLRGTEDADLVQHF